MESSISISVKIGCYIWICTGGIIGVFAIFFAVSMLINLDIGSGILAVALALTGGIYVYIGKSVLNARVKDTLGYGIISVVIVLLVLYVTDDSSRILYVLRNSLIIFPLLSGGLLMLIGRNQYKIHKEYIEKINP